MRIFWPARRTLPSSSERTFSVRAMVPMSTLRSLKANEQVRAVTCSYITWESALINSSVTPSEKYSWALSPLIFTNGSTAIECGGGS